MTTTHTDLEIRAMAAGTEVDRMAAEAIGFSLKPVRDVALVKIAIKYISMTGPEFHLRTGDIVPVPDGKDLPQPEGSDHWNDRYYRFIGNWLSEKYSDIAREVDGYHLPAKSYSTDPRAAATVRDWCLENGTHITLAYGRFTKEKGWTIFSKGIEPLFAATEELVWCKLAILLSRRLRGDEQR